MPDGIKIAVDIWLPQTLTGISNGKNRFPVAVEFTRYWRIAEERPTKERVLRLVEQGFAHAVVDCRGSGASFGMRTAEQSDIEIKDFATVIDWLAEQPWCNGNVISMGTSYSANTAEYAMFDAPLALKAAIPRFSDFDIYTTITFPGGLLNNGFLKPWGEGVYAMDMNQTDDINTDWEDYRGLRVKPVDEDTDKALLRQAVAEHQNNVPLVEQLESKVYRDDFELADGFNDSGHSMSPHLLQHNQRLQQVFSYHWASFTDAGTASGAIARFMGSTAPMRVVIGYWSHGAELDTNPFKSMGGDATPSFEDQHRHIADYLSQLSSPDKESPDRLNERALYYFTAGEDVWKKTQNWPPKEMTTERWYLSSNARLGLDPPQNSNGSDQYQVDFDAGTGLYTRWDQMEKIVHYGDRADADKQLLTYTSKPLPQAAEITGHPVVHLQLASTRADGAVIVYLETVAPDGQVTLLTEGGLRLIHRKVSNEKPPYSHFGPYHTFEKKDALPMPIGERVEVGFECLPLSMRIPEGHALRIAIGGHDKDCFDRLPETGDVSLTVYRHKNALSFIDIPLRYLDKAALVDTSATVNPFTI